MIQTADFFRQAKRKDILAKSIHSHCMTSILHYYIKIHSQIPWVKRAPIWKVILFYLKLEF